MFNWFKWPKQAVRKIKDLQFEVEELKEQVAALSRQKDPQHSVGALDYIVYKNNILDKIGNTYLSSTDSAEYKLGIQFALRHIEKVAVIGR